MKRKEIKLIEKKLAVYGLPVGIVVGMIEDFNENMKQMEHDLVYGTGTEEPVGIIQWLSEQNKYYEFCDGWFTYYVNTKTGEKKFKLENGDILVANKLDDFSR